MVNSDAVKRSELLLSYGMPKGYENGKHISAFKHSDDFDNLLSAAYLTYAHNNGVTLRDLVCAMLAVVKHIRKYDVEVEISEEFAEEDMKDRLAYTQMYHELCDFIANADGGLELNPDYSGLFEFVMEWGDNDYERMPTHYRDYANALLAYHRNGDTLLTLIDNFFPNIDDIDDIDDFLCIEDPRSIIAREARCYEMRPGGKTSALKKFFLG